MVEQALGGVYLVLSLLGLTLYLTRKWVVVYKKGGGGTKKLPPSPRKLPILGNLHQVSDLGHGPLELLGRKYGPIMLLQMGSKPVIIVQSADAAREIMKTNDLLFADRPHTVTTKRLCYNLKDMSVAPYGEHWRNLRSITTLKLLSAKMVQSFDFIRHEETSLLMEEIKNSASRPQPVNLSRLFWSLANDVICRAVFGRKYSSQSHSQSQGDDEFLTLLGEVCELFGCVTIGEFIPWLWWLSYVNGFNARLEKAAAKIDHFLDGIFQERMVDNNNNNNNNNTNNLQQSGGDWDNFFDILVHIYKENQAQGLLSIDRDAIKALVLDLLDAGTDTTSANLEWAMAELLRNPKVLRKLQNEVRETTKDKEKITETELKQMQYLKAVVKETLRLHPPIATAGRSAREDVKVMGYDIPRGTMVLINNWAIGRDPKFWCEPDKFMPERFLNNNNSSMDFKGLDFNYIPFGAGRRGCPGISFAIANIEHVLASLVRNFDWELPDGTEPRDLDMTEHPGTAVHRKSPLLAVATPTRCYF
ncbi:hypothetical protein ABFX02_14G290100 [Erythranthe guttata]